MALLTAEEKQAIEAKYMDLRQRYIDLAGLYDVFSPQCSTHDFCVKKSDAYRILTRFMNEYNEGRFSQWLFDLAEKNVKAFEDWVSVRKNTMNTPRCVNNGLWTGSDNWKWFCTECSCREGKE